MESVQDIHICGGCGLKFTDIIEFISHKIQCYPSNLSLLNSPNVYEQLITQFVKGQPSTIEVSHHVGGESELQQAEDAENISVSCISTASDSSLSTMLGSMINNLSAPSNTVHQNLTGNTNHNNLLTWQIKGEFKKEPASTVHSSIVSNIIVQANNAQQNFFTLSPQKSSENILFDDIAVYVVSPKSFHAKRNPKDVSNNKMVCSINQGSFLNHNSKSTDSSHSVTKPITQSHTNLTLQQLAAPTASPKEFRHQSKYFLDSDNNTSEGSTPCPEDLEVGQISATMLGDRLQRCSQRLALDIDQSAYSSSGLGNSDKSILSTKNFKEECPGVPEYIREQTASAPIMKDVIYTTRRISVEKRERLQGVSDDLLSSPHQDLSSPHQDLSSPHQDTATNKTELYHKKSIELATTETHVLGQAPASNHISQLTGYKAVFTSPSCAGHRLKPTKVSQLTSDAKVQNKLRTDKMAAAVVYSNISANSGVVIANSTKEPMTDMSKLKGKKVDRKIVFGVGGDVQPMSDICIDGQSKETKSSHENCLHSLTYQQTSAVDDGSAICGGDVDAGSNCLSKTGAAQFELTDLHLICGALPDNKQNGALHDTKSQSCKSKSRIDTHASFQAPLSSSNTPGRELVDIIPTSSSAMDDNAMIMVYDTADGNYVLVPKKSFSGSAEMASFQTFHSGSISESSNSIVSVSHGPQQQSSDSDFYINVIPSGSTDCTRPQLLVHNFCCPDPKMQQWITISTGNPALGSSLGTLSGDQDSQVSTAREVSTQRQEVVKLDVMQHANIEREKCIRKPKKPKQSSQIKTYSTQMSKTVTPRKGKSTMNTCEENLKDKVEESQDNRKSKIFLCKFDNCRYTTTLFKDFQRHYRKHTGERPFKCNECDKRFSRSDKLNIHIKWHAGVKLFKCNLCDYAAFEGGSLKKHMRIHNDERPFQCQICSYASRNSSQLIVHLRTHTGDTPFHCTQCSAKFKINSDLKRHLRTHTGEKPFQCELCAYRSSNKGNLKTHVRINHSKENEISCPTCPFVTSSKKRLREHSKVHNAKQLVSCDKCDYTCTNLNALRSHTSIHNTIKPYRCSRCSFTCKQSGNLKKHIQNLHLDKVHLSKHAESTNTAQVNKRSSHLRNLDVAKDCRHRVASSSYKKSYLCKECGYSFVREDSLRCHMKQHNNSDTTEVVLKDVIQDMRKEEEATKDSSVYGCQGIQHIVAAASKLSEENISAENSHPGLNSERANGIGLSLGGQYNRSVQRHSQQTKIVKSQDGISPAGLARKTHLPWEHRSYTLNADHKTGRSAPGKRYTSGTVGQEGEAQPSKRKKMEALPASADKSFHVVDGIQQEIDVPHFMQPEACFTPGNSRMTISSATGLETLLVSQKDESCSSLEPTYSIQLVAQPSALQHSSADMSMYAQELIGQLTSHDFQQLQYQSGVSKFQIVFPPGATVLDSTQPDNHE